MVKRTQKSNRGTQADSNGFTLLEVIVSIVIAAILGTIVIQYMGSGLSSSSISLNNIKDDYKLEQVIEEFTREYRYWLESAPDQTINNFKATYIDGEPSVLTGVGKTEIFQLTGGDDAAGVQVLRVAVSDGKQTIYTLFTK